MNQLATRKGVLHRFGPQKLPTSDSPISEESRRIRDWLLGFLRFAVTLEQRDQAAVMCLAAEMDRLGVSRTRSGFSYFTWTSTKLCDAIAAKHDSEKLSELRNHLEKIDDDRLRRALEGALFEKKLNEPARSKKLDRAYLWTGLATK